ncbi:hypothetical protein AAFF_G00010200 [Aldrovandia affinis]|uniref:Uncharacterized protein n=1 Tax=Aldrovandia affinis TaxID=143900 RepID=A0AAD7WHE6_9TELE|nr:hypothetical protein AAFF_G00010200 [Aldrovandia affinis]
MELEGKSTGQGESGTPAISPSVTAPSAPTPSPSVPAPAPTVSAPSPSSTPTTTTPPDAKDPVVRPALPQRRGLVSALQNLGQQRHPTPVYHDMLPAFMCPKEPCDAPLVSERGPAAVIAPVRFEARPSFKPQRPAPEPINGEVRRESRFACGPSSRPIRRPSDRAPRPAIVNPAHLRDLDDLDKDCEDGWAGLHEDVDYGEKLRFSDEEEDRSPGEKGRKWLPWGKQCERQASLRSGEGPPPSWRPPAEIQEEREEPRRGQCPSPGSSEAEERTRQRREEGERRDVCASKLKEPDEKKEGERDLENRPPSPNLPLSRIRPDTWQYTAKEFSELPSGQNSRQDCGEAKTLGAHYRADDRGPTETSTVPESGRFQKSLPPRFQKQQDQLYEAAQWPQSGRPANPPHGYCPSHMLGLDPRWRMMPPYMDPRGAQGRLLQDYYPPALHSGVMKQAIPQDHPGSPGPGSASDESCHPRMHQERPTEPYPSWEQESYPSAQARSLTPLYRRLENGRDIGHSDDRKERPCSQDTYEEFADGEDLPPQGCGQGRTPGVALEPSSQKESRTEAHSPKGRASPGSPDYPQPDPKELGYGGNGIDGRASRDQQCESADRDGGGADLWRNQGPQKQDWGLQSQWADPSVASSVGGRPLARRIGPMRRPVLKALNVEDKENEKPTPEAANRPVPYRFLEREAIVDAYDLKLDSASPPLGRRGPLALAKEKSPVPLRAERSDSPTDDGPVGSCLERNKTERPRPERPRPERPRPRGPTQRGLGQQRPSRPTPQ